MSEQDSTEAPAAPAHSNEQASTAAPSLPTIRDHAERLQLEPWQVKAVVARMHGEHDKDGKRVHEKGVDLNTRLSDEDFAKALDTALHGRV